jgi:hypothetical protein
MGGGGGGLKCHISNDDLVFFSCSFYNCRSRGNALCIVSYSILRILELQIKSFFLRASTYVPTNRKTRRKERGEPLLFPMTRGRGELK